MKKFHGQVIVRGRPSIKDLQAHFSMRASRIPGLARRPTSPLQYPAIRAHKAHSARQRRKINGGGIRKRLVSAVLSLS